MTLEEAIKHCEENRIKEICNGNFKCADEHKQLKKWLEELKSIKEK